MNRPKGETERSSLMNVGRRVDYAVRALAYLAGQPQGKIVSKVEIERKQDIPPYFLSKIMRDLVVRGLVESRIGSKGGFRLARPAKTISIKEVYEAVESPLNLMECFDKGDTYCQLWSACGQVSIWEWAQGLVANYLASVSIADISDHEGLRDRLIRLQGAALTVKRNPVNDL